jgi:hypothetical protein
VTNTLKLHRNGAVGFMDWLDLSAMNKLILFLSKLLRRDGGIMLTAVNI